MPIHHIPRDVRVDSDYRSRSRHHSWLQRWSGVFPSDRIRFGEVPPRRFAGHGAAFSFEAGGQHGTIIATVHIRPVNVSDSIRAVYAR
jgi:hypothetical protein